MNEVEMLLDSVGVPMTALVPVELERLTVPVGPITELELERDTYGADEDSDVTTPIAELVPVTEILPVPVGPTTELELEGKP